AGILAQGSPEPMEGWKNRMPTGYCGKHTLHPQEQSSFGEKAINQDRYDDDYIAGILKTTTTIALLGASPNPDRPSNRVMSFLLSRGYEVIPVNPGQAGKEIHGRKVYAKLADIPGPVDMVDVFRAAEYLDGIVEEAIALPH